MASLKELRGRIASVQSTRKITSAMKLVAAAKLRRAQEQAQAARPYAERMEAMLASLAASTTAPPPLMAGRAGAGGAGGGGDGPRRHLLLVATADRGLCGGFNANIVREARRDAERLLEAGDEVRFYCLGRKGRDALRMQHGERIVETIEGLAKPRPEFARVEAVAEDLARRFDEGEFDECVLYGARFHSAIRQEPRRARLIPLSGGDGPAEGADGAEGGGKAEESPSTTVPAAHDARAAHAAPGAPPEFEPSQEALLAELLPRNLAVQLWRAVLENDASEHGARMTAMDNATRNAGDMIRRLTIVYNRTRQAAVTTELIEIISAKEAL